jgi:hypothetical protein
MRLCTYETSSDNLPRMLSRIVERNLGSYYDAFHFPNPRADPNILQRALFCLGT